ncbi:hypothetical protein RRG08_035997, partial [Elysia crispata]
YFVSFENSSNNKLLSVKDPFRPRFLTSFRVIFSVPKGVSFSLPRIV